MPLFFIKKGRHFYHIFRSSANYEKHIYLSYIKTFLVIKAIVDQVFNRPIIETFEAYGGPHWTKQQKLLLEKKKLKYFLRVGFI